MHSRYETLEEHDLRWLGQGIGVQVAESALRTKVGFMHPGDDAGRVASFAYRQFGAESAGEVLRSFKRGYDPVRIAGGSDAVSDEEFINTVGMALSIELATEEIDEVRDYLRQRAADGPLTEKIDKEIWNV